MVELGFKPNLQMPKSRALLWRGREERRVGGGERGAGQVDGEGRGGERDGAGERRERQVEEKEAEESGVKSEAKEGAEHR